MKKFAAALVVLALLAIPAMACPNTVGFVGCHAVTTFVTPTFTVATPFVPTVTAFVPVTTTVQTFTAPHIVSEAPPVIVASPPVVEVAAAPAFLGRSRAVCVAAHPSVACPVACGIAKAGRRAAFIARAPFRPRLAFATGVAVPLRRPVAVAVAVRPHVAVRVRHH